MPGRRRKAPRLMSPFPNPIPVLTYDDDPPLRAVYRELLGEEGYRVTLAAEPLSDPADVAALGPNLVIVDLMAGRQETGSGFLAGLKAHPDTRHLPVLVCSGDSVRLSEMEWQLSAWGCRVVGKPFDIDVFLGAVRACLDAGAGRPIPAVVLA